MKKIAAIMVAVIVLLGGCGQMDPDASQLQARIDSLEQENKELQSQLDGDIESTEEKGNGFSLFEQPEDDEESYARNNMELVSGQVEYSKGYSWSGPGLVDVEVKNNGDRTVSNVFVTVYFLDEDQKPIAENRIMVMGGFTNPHSLKPNYSWRMEDDVFYKLENLPSNVDVSRYDIQVTEVYFEE